MMRLMGYLPCDTYLGDLAIGGSTVATMNARAAACDATLIPTATKHLLVIWIGTNDLFQGGTGAACYAATASYITARQTAGWTIVALTVLPSTKVGTPGTYEAERLALNVLLRANVPHLVDVAADARLQNTLDTTYFNADQLHLIAPGYAVVASLVKPVVQALF